MKQINFLKVQKYPIFDLLRLEEALLKADDGNWCILNIGTSPAIVMGISGKEELLIDRSKIKQQNITIIRRFTGGGTVVVDEETIFATFIFNCHSLDVSAYPEHVMKWSESFYRPIFKEHPFQLKENDFVIGQHKFGGNAQYMRKQRWLHHSSILWDFCSKRMECLLHPPKMPTYRENRSHDTFLCKLKNYYDSKMEWINLFEQRIHSLFQVHYLTTNQLDGILERPHHQSTQLIKVFNK